MTANHCRNFCLRYSFSNNEVLFKPICNCKNCKHVKEGLCDKKMRDLIAEEIKNSNAKKKGLTVSINEFTSNKHVEKKVEEAIRGYCKWNRK